MRMSDRTVALETIELFITVAAGVQGFVKEPRMARDTVVQRNPPRDRTRSNVRGHRPERHRQRMSPTILGLRVPLSDKVSGYMTVRTGGCVRMFTPTPIIERLLHHMAVGTGTRSVTQVRGALGIFECVECGSDGDREKTNHDGQESIALRHRVV